MPTTVIVTPKFIEFEDGIIAFALGAPTMSHSLGLDPEGYRKTTQIGVFATALQRGYDRITTLAFPHNTTLRQDSSPAEISAWMRHVPPPDVAVAIDYLSTDRNIAVFRVSKP